MWTRRMPKTSVAGVALAVAVVAGWPQWAHANPAFARKYGMPCSSCHTAWPLLNAAGRRFKENGFRLSRDEKPRNAISDFLQFDEKFPISALVKSRPYDKKENGDEKIRALHEAELMVSGVVAPDVSAFFEIEAEDEDGFSPALAEGHIGYHPWPFLNVQLGYNPIFAADPYDPLSGMRRLTRNRSQVIDQRFGGADNNGRLRDSRQTVALYGRPIDQVFYSLGYSGVAKDTEGVNASNVHGRLAVEPLPDVMVGGFGVIGRCETSAANCAQNRDFSRFGFDGQADYRNVRVSAAYVRARDDRAGVGAGEATNNAWFVQALYVYERNGRPFLVPLVRFDQYETNGGRSQFDEVTLNLSYYHWENVRAFVEYWTQVDAPTGVDKDQRVTLQLEVAF